MEGDAWSRAHGPRMGHMGTSQASTPWPYPWRVTSSAVGLLGDPTQPMIDHVQVLVELDEETLRRLEAVAPGKSRKRSAFIRAAVQKALWDLEEERTRRAYLESPDAEPYAFDVASWEPLPFGGFEPPREKKVARPPTKTGRPELMGL